VSYLRKKFPEARRVGKTCLQERLHEAGLQYLRRRRKTLLSPENRLSRCTWADWVNGCRASTLSRWVYSDGTVFYLDRCAAEAADKKQAALGSHVWRMADGKDALYADCVGASSYAKAQGQPVHVWGLLAEGVLHITILPRGEHMNRRTYASTIENRFTEWLADHPGPLVVQDYEKCLRCEEPLRAFKAAGMKVLELHPKRSPDLNAIENAWHLLRNRLDLSGMRAHIRFECFRILLVFLSLCVSCLPFSFVVFVVLLISTDKVSMPQCPSSGRRVRSSVHVSAGLCYG
jgi:hypothetical protein